MGAHLLKTRVLSTWTDPSPNRLQNPLLWLDHKMPLVLPPPQIPSKANKHDLPASRGRPPPPSSSPLPAQGWRPCEACLVGAGVLTPPGSSRIALPGQARRCLRDRWRSKPRGAVRPVLNKGSRPVLNKGRQPRLPSIEVGRAASCHWAPLHPILLTA